MDELRALSRVRSLITPMTTLLLQRLLRPLHNLRWQEISLPIPLDDEFAALLPQLPSLTKIVDGWTTCSRFDWLCGLPNLTDVDLVFEVQAAAGRAESLVAGLQSCTNIESISLGNHLTAAHLAELLPRLPRLRALSLHCLDIDSLAFLAQPPMISQLISLCLDHCQQLPLPELRHVHALRALQQHSRATSNRTAASWAGQPTPMHLRILRH